MQNLIHSVSPNYLVLPLLINLARAASPNYLVLPHHPQFLKFRW